MPSNLYTLKRSTGQIPTNASRRVVSTGWGQHRDHGTRCSSAGPTTARVCTFLVRGEHKAGPLVFREQQAGSKTRSLMLWPVQCAREHYLVQWRDLQELAKGRTSVFVAHRLSTIKDCDQILVLSEGALVEEGTHQGLLRLGGVYSDMWQMQARPGPTPLVDVTIVLV